MTTTVTAKGQVTLPKRVRDAMGIKPGAKVEVEFRDGGAFISPSRKPKQSEIRASFEKVRGTLDLGMTTDEFMKLMRGDD